MMSVRAATLSRSVPEERTVLSQRTSLGPFIFSRTVEQRECSDKLQIICPQTKFSDALYGRVKIGFGHFRWEN